MAKRTAPTPREAPDRADSAGRPEALARRATEVPLPRRRPAKAIALGVALAAVGAAASLVAIANSGDKTAVVVISRDVAAGDQLGLGDLATTSVALSSVVDSVPGETLDSYVGRYATTDLRRGSLLVPDDAAGAPVVASGRSLVGLSLGDGQVATTPLRVGDTVRAVVISDPNGTGSAAGSAQSSVEGDTGGTSGAAAGATPAPAPSATSGTATSGTAAGAGVGATYAATVRRVGTRSVDGRTAVDLEVAVADGPALGVAAAARRVVLLTLSAASTGSK